MNYIEIPLTKCRIFLTEKELVGLLRNDMELYKESLKRGKAFCRSTKQQIREAEHFGEHEVAAFKKKLH